MTLKAPEKSSDREEPSEPLLVSLRHYWAAVVRRKWLVISAILAGVSLASALCVWLPKSYRSSTLILIENQKIPDEYVKGIGGASIEERLTMIQQQVMSRTLLSQIIEEFRLYEGQVQREGLESAIERIRKTIKVETVGTAGSRGKSVEAVTLSFAHEQPMTAMKVTAKLASLFIEENLKVREQLVTGVSVFLEQELQDARKALEAQEQAISQYKSKFIGVLPQQMEANLRALDRLQADLNASDDLLHSQTDRLGLVEKTIKEYEATGSMRSEGSGSATSPAGLDPLVVRLRELERRLTTLTAEWKESYPDIGETRQEIQNVKKQLAEKYGEPSLAKEGDTAKTFDPYLRELNKQRNELRADLASIKERRQRLLEQIKQFEQRVEQTPAREQEVMILLRDYENMQKNYQALLDKRLNAHVAVNLEKRQKGEQFRVLDPANLPQRLDSPNRLLIMVLGLLGGTGLGVGAALGLDQLNPTYRRTEEVETIAHVHVLATIPDFSPRGIPIPSQGAANGNGHLQKSGWRKMTTLSESSRGGASTGPRIDSLIAKWQPLSIAAEQYRMAASRLVLSTEARGSTVLEITSALKGEGKTTTVVNLGYTIARDLGKRTLLLDCDLRSPTLHHYLDAKPRAGMLELLEGAAVQGDCVARIDEVPCWIMPVGNSIKEQSELTHIQQLRALLPTLRLQYDYVIINAPPVLPSATVGILASLADVLIMVIRAGSTPKHVLQKAFLMLGLTVEKQVILNGVDPSNMPHTIYGYSASPEGHRPAGPIVIN